MARVKIVGADFLREALAEIAPAFEAAVKKAVQAAGHRPPDWALTDEDRHRIARLLARPPTPEGFVRLHIGAVVNRKLLEDEPALGSFLVSLVKRELEGRTDG